MVVLPDEEDGGVGGERGALALRRRRERDAEAVVQLGEVRVERERRGGVGVVGRRAAAAAARLLHLLDQQDRALVRADREPALPVLGERVRQVRPRVHRSGSAATAVW